MLDMASSLDHLRALISGPRSLGCDTEIEAKFSILLNQAKLIVTAFDRRQDNGAGYVRTTDCADGARMIQQTEASTTLGTTRDDTGSLPSSSVTSLRQSSGASEAARVSSSSQPATVAGSASCIPFREEDGIVTLLPRTAEECRDLPRLMARAAELGASFSGVFKFVMADDVDMATEAVQVHHVSRFRGAAKPDGTYQIDREMVHENMKVERCPTQESTADELACALEEVIYDQEKLTCMRYCTDESACAPAERQQLGLLTDSPLTLLKDNQLNQTKNRVPGLHSPYLYVSNDVGGIFTLHAEDGNLHSLNVLYWGGFRVWITIIPQHRTQVERRIRRWRCAQRVRHASVFVPRSVLDEWGVSYNVFVQRPRETVVVSGHTLHEGGVLSRSVAEAVNYGPPGWDITGYAECSTETLRCPGFPIPNESLAFLARGESQCNPGAVDEIEPRDYGEVHAGSTPDKEDTSVHEVPRAAEKSSPDLRRQHLARRTVKNHAKLQRDALSRMRSSQHVQKRRARASLSPRLPRASRSAPAGSRDLVSIEQTMKNIDKHCHIPSYDPHEPPSVKVLQLVAAVQSRSAIQQFCAIVRSRRQAGVRENGSYGEGCEYQTAVVHAMSIAAAKDRSIFEKFSTRLHQCRLAEELEIARGARRRNESKTLDAICKSCGWTRDNLEYHRKRGLKWTRVCGPYAGLLSFIPFGLKAFGIAADAYLDLTDMELQEFHLSLQGVYSQALCSAGGAFEESLRWDVHDVSFRWEEEDAPLEKLPETSMLCSLQPFPTKFTDLYEPNVEWPVPTDWPTDWAWPIDPTTVMPDSGQQCDFCPEPSCECFRTVFVNAGRAKPRIRDYGKKGRGLQAVAGIPGQTAYKTRQVIGRMTGKIVPVDTPDDGWALELTRPDLPQAGPVCHISCLTYGSNLRLLNHSCRPSTIFQLFRISGHFGYAVVALRDIYHGEEMTVSYGKDYFKQRGLLCLCEMCQAE